MKYYDFALVSWLTLPRGKRDFVSCIEKELSIHIDDTSFNRVYFTHQMWELQDKTYVIPRELEFIVDRELELLPIFAQMENTWVNIDEKKLTHIGEQIRRGIEKIENEIYEIVGERFNIASPKQIQELFLRLGIPLTKKNKTGFSVDIDVLEEIAKKYDIARLILEHRSLAKLESTYVIALLRAQNKTTGRIHTTYDTLGASTWRISSNDPNLQNIPTSDGYARDIKSCFIPSYPIGDNEYIFLVADYSQIELRVLAFLSQDRALLDAFVHGEDIHTRTARFLFPNSEIISSHERRIAKTVNFWVIYWITGFWLSKTLDCSPWEANAYIEAFYIKYPWVREYYNTLLASWAQNGYVETYFWRRRYISGLQDANKTMRSIAEREAMNMPVQWTAADILKIAMIAIDKKIRELKLTWKMILQVHDELVFDIPLSEKSIFESLVRECMEWVLAERWRESVSNLSFPPITVDIHTGTNWADAKQ
jgi:DNA polymerase-1